MRLFYTIRPCDLFTSPKMTNVVCRLPVESVLLEDEPNNAHSNPGLIRVIFQATTRLEGWVKTMYVDEVRHVLPFDVVRLDNQTASRQDAAQYIRREGRVEYNLCGEICVAYLLGIDLESLLQNWKAKPITAYHRIFKGKLAATTGIPDLIDMLPNEPRIETAKVADIFACGSYPIITPARLIARLSEGWRFIVAVTINRAGRLKPTGTPHWITIIAAAENGVGEGWVDFFDPYLNRVRRASWDVFGAALHTPHGVGVLYGKNFR